MEDVEDRSGILGSRQSLTQRRPELPASRALNSLTRYALSLCRIHISARTIGPLKLPVDDESTTKLHDVKTLSSARQRYHVYLEFTIL